MCSIGEDDFGDEGGQHAMKECSPEIETNPVDEICRKCNEKPAVLKLNLKEPQCRQCFLHYVRHKFRASMGATKIVRRGSRVMVVFDGSADNVVMMDMIRYGLQQEAFKKLRIIPVVLLLGEDFIEQDDSGYRKALEEKITLLKQFDFGAYFAVIGGSQYCAIEQANLWNQFQEDIFRFRKVLNSIKSTTSKQDFITQTKKRTLRNIAKKLECPYIFLSDIGVDLAKSLLSNVALGRGRSLSLDIAFCDDRDESCKIIRPMRDLNPDEIENYFKHSETPLNKIITKLPFDELPSLQNQAAKFVDDLQATFPSTVSTVYRTGDKFSAPCLPEANNDGCDPHIWDMFAKKLQINQEPIAPTRCKFCHSELDYQGSTTLLATEFSRMVSTKINVQLSHELIVSSTNAMEEEAVRALDGDLESDGFGLLKKELCHGCRNIFVGFQDN
ncbi:cytoplasmic tRNA 2-thiolation protein 2 [Uranotaenia lowii]|uniref:cytoplasmic tRNA 2-thiolation protein 2 n=1 Tax=Uranotaenia lowii TaxID=190385 RepID=UPI002479AB0C|nr:cytoplasmic tRNA 2-thiolation protein 2 [Uranotaenia lowii]